MKLCRASFARLLVLVAALWAAEGATAARLFAQAPAGDRDKQVGKAYTVDTKASHVYVRVDPDGRGHAHGVAGDLVSGAVTLGAAAKAGELVFDLGSFAADQRGARDYLGMTGKVSDFDRRSVTQNMLGADVLNVREYPKATYAVTAVTALDGQDAGQPGRYRFEGRLSLHGVDRPVRFEAKAEAGAAAGGLRLRGQFTLVQSDFKIKPYSALLGALRIKDALDVHGDLQLVPATEK